MSIAGVGERAIGRILSWGAIALLRPTRRHRPGQPQAPPYLALLRLGFTVPGHLAVPAVGSYPAVSPLPAPLLTGGGAAGGLFSVALSRGCPLSACAEQPALGSPDLPQGLFSPRGSLTVSPTAAPSSIDSEGTPQLYRATTGGAGGATNTADTDENEST